MRQASSLKPQDILVLLKVLLWQDRKWRQLDLATELGLSQTEVNFALSRLVKSRLLDESKRKPQKLSLKEFLIHGLRYVYPGDLGPSGRGVATAQSHASLSKRLVAEQDHQFVWLDPDGQLRGQSLVPLYPSVPFAAKKDPELHEWLALIDALRIGSVRVQKLAAERISRKIDATA